MCIRWPAKLLSEIASEFMELHSAFVDVEAIKDMQEFCLGI